MTYKYPFALEPLQYSYKALEPYIDEEILFYHHDKHLATYVNNLNNTLKDYKDLHDMSLKELLINIDKLPKEIQTPLRNNGGGVYNHNLYFEIMRSPKDNNEPIGSLAHRINEDFGSYDEFVKLLSSKSIAQFGSGWGWLLCDKVGKLSITATANQDVPCLKDNMPILPLDVWEHAYYLKYKNMRADYVKDWFNLVNWELANNMYEARESYFK